MASIEVGRVCVKTAGREAGEVVGEAVKNRRCNIAHLEPTEETIDVSSDAESIKAALADL